jgi:hypothetical protein
MTPQHCIECNKPFQPRSVWQTRCYDCFKNFKQRKAEYAWGDPFGGNRGNFESIDKSGVDRDGVWLRANIKSLLHLCHPDKHGGSEQSTDMTRELIKIFKGR